MQLPDLFIKKERSLQKEASYRLGSDCKNWEQDIVDRLHEEHPYLPDYDINVVLRKRDESSGSGVGQIHIDDKVRIPIIIKGFKLMPLDLMMYDGEVLPVTKQSLENITHTDSVGKSVRPHAQGSDMGIRAATRAPHYGKYAFASSLEFAPTEVARIVDLAYSTPATLNYDVKDSSYFRSGLAKFAGAAKQKMEKVASEDRTNYSFGIKAQWQDVNHGPVLTADGPALMCKVATIDGTIREQRLLVLEDGRTGLMEKTAGVPCEAKQVKLASSTPSGWGVFVAKLGDDYVSTEPMKVMYKTAEATVVKTGLGQKLSLHQNAEFSGWTKIAQDVYLSDDWKFIPTAGKVTPHTARGLNKLAASRQPVALTESNGYYSVKGDAKGTAFEKLAGRFYSLEEMGRELSADLTTEELAELSKTASDANIAGTDLYAYMENPVQETGFVMNTLDENQIQSFVRAAGQFTETAVKEAGIDEVTAENTVDRLLGINFLNDQNVSRLVESCDDLCVARGVLGRLLIAGRMGLDIDVNVVRTALFALDAVIKDLRGLRHTVLAK